MMRFLKKLLINEAIIEHKEEFVKESMVAAIHHIRLLCIGILVFSAYFFYADIFLFRNIDSHVFRLTLITGHFVGFILSALFLCFYRYFKQRVHNTNLLKLVFRVFIIVLLLMGSLPAITNQRFTGNIDAYIVVVLIAAVGFPFELIFMLTALVANHILFLIGISIFSNNYTSLVSKQINSSAMLVAALIFFYSIYRHRVLDFCGRQNLIKSEYNFKQLFSINPMPMLITNYETGRVIMANHRASDFYGYTQEEFVNVFAKDLYVNEGTRQKLLEELKAFGKVDNSILEHKSKVGIKKWVVAHIQVINYYGEKCILTSVTDITELKKMESQLSKHASVDPLTGILNRRTGIELFKTLIESSKAENKAFVVCFIDIDNLKQVNDTFGHSEGDNLINAVCLCINNHIKPTDIFFRYGGDEFVVLFPNQDKKQVESIWSLIQDNFEKSSLQEEYPYPINASHGLYQYDGKSNYTIEEILKLADEEMYLEKNTRKS